MRLPLKIGAASVAGIAFGIVLSAAIPRVVAAHRASRQEAPELSPLEKHDLDLANFQNEERNSTWADPAVVSFREHVTRSNGFGKSFQLKELDCHARSCIAEIEWRTHDAAEKGFRELLGVSSRELEGCMSEIYLSPEEHTPYVASLVLKGCRGRSTP